MRTYLADALSRLAGWLRPKSMPAVLTGSQWSGTSFIDAYRRNRNPTPNEILAELKNTAWTCASTNAAVCASFPPKLYVATRPDQQRPKCLTKSLPAAAERRLRSAPHLAARTKSADRIEEVADHPLLDLLVQVNPVMNAFDLWELTTLYQEVHGAAYWLLDLGPLGTPQRIWILPSQNVTPRREPGSPNLVDYLPLPHRHERAAFPAGSGHPLPLPRPARPVHRRAVAAAGLLRTGGAHQRVRGVQKGQVREPRHPRRHRVAGRGDRRGGARSARSPVEQPFP